MNRLTNVLTVIQAMGVLAVLAGVALALPLFATLIVDGVLLVVTATAAEHIARGALRGPSVRPSALKTSGVE